MAMTSVKTQLPYDYYDMPFCGPENKKYKSLNLGEVLRGNRIANTLYNVSKKYLREKFLLHKYLYNEYVHGNLKIKFTVCTVIQYILLSNTKCK